MVKIIFIDFDGTLYSHKLNKIPQSTIDAINLVRKNNIKVFLCTGRDINELYNFDLKGVEFDGMILLNGQQILDQDKNVIKEIPLNEKLRKEIAYRFVNHIMPMTICTKRGFYINYINDYVQILQKRISSPLPEVKEYEGEDIFMTSFFCESDKDLQDVMSFKDYANITYWYNGGVDVTSKGVDKSTAIDSLIKILKIDRKDTMAIGDGDNDKTMIKYCNIGVALQEGDEELKKAADYITTACEDDAIYNAFKHYNLF